MIDKGLSSMLDLRSPEINVKQGSTDILSDTGKSEDIVGISPGSSAEVTFTIENIGTAELILKNPPVTISGDDASEFPQASVTQPEDSVIAAGRNTTFKVTFAPTSIGIKNATITIENNDFDESSYTFSITGNTNPKCDFAARLRRGITSLSVDFKDKSEGDITSWLWDFDGDGESDSGEQNPTYTYNRPGTYSVMLTVTGPGGFHYKIKSNYITITMPVENSIYGSFNNAKSVCAADLDNDGSTDIIGVDYGSGPDYDDGEVAWWANSDSASFGDKQSIASLTKARSVCAADLNGTTGIDILAAADDEIAWWPNNGSGSFGAKQTISSNFNYAYKVLAGDIDGVNGIDVITSSDVTSPEDYKGLIFWPNNGSGNFLTMITIGAWTFADAILADIDKDGDIDVVASSTGTPGAIKWYENINGNGTSWPEQEIDSAFPNATSIVAADLDNDGDLDILALGNPNDVYEIAIWENTDGNGSFASRKTLSRVFVNPTAVYTTDIEGDGDIDIIGTGDSRILLWENFGNGDFNYRIIHYSFIGACAIHGADIDRIGKSDMDIIIAGDNSISWFNINPDGFYKKILDASFVGANSVYTGDLNGDDNMDVVSTSSSGQGLVAWWENSGDGNFSTSTFLIDYQFAGACSVYTADINNDNALDVIAAGSDSVARWINTDNSGLSWDKYTPGSLGGGDKSAYAADIDNDGDMDILGSDTGSGLVAWWKNPLIGSNTNWDIYYVFSGGGSPLSLKTADIDGDGDTDVFYTNGSYIEWRENPYPSFGVTPWTVHEIDTGFTDARSIYLIDIDKDGDMDVVSAVDDNGSIVIPDKIAWWENENGLGTSWDEHVVDDDYDIADDSSIFTSVCAADIDGDNDPDVLATSSGADTIVWWENTDGSGTTWTKYIIASGFDGASSVHAEDIDNDGDIDVIGTAADSGEVVVFENNLVDWGQ